MKTMQQLGLPLALILSLALPGKVQATVDTGAVTGGGSLSAGGTFIKLGIPFVESDPDNTVGDDTFQSPHLYAFDEDQDFSLATDLDVDILADGFGGGGGPGVISAGLIVASHYVFFDPGNVLSQTGTVEFSQDILGVITSTQNLAASDGAINTGVTYLNPGLRGLEAGDSVTITGFRQVTVDWSAGTPGDYVRVMTSIPEPSAFALACLGALLLHRPRLS